MSRKGMMHVCVKEEWEDKGERVSEGWWYVIVCVVLSSCFE